MRLIVKQLTFEEYPEVQRDVAEALRQGDTVLDFGQVDRVDSTAVALLLYAKRQAQTLGLTLKCENLPESYDELVMLYGLEDVLSETLQSTNSQSSE